MGHDETEWFVDTKGSRSYVLLNGDRSRAELVRDALVRHGHSTGSMGLSRYRANDGKQYDWFLTLSINPNAVQLRHLRDVIGKAVAEGGRGICGDAVGTDDAVEGDDDAEEKASSDIEDSLVVCRRVYDSGRLQERWDAIVKSVPDCLERSALPCYRVVGWRVTTYEDDGKLRARGPVNAKKQRHGEWRVRNDATGEMEVRYYYRGCPSKLSPEQTREALMSGGGAPPDPAWNPPFGAEAYD